MDIVTGYVEHIVFRNEENGYTVFNLNSEDGDLTCVGTLHYISEGELVELEGEYQIHPVYGTQFKVESYQVKDPEDLVSIERYLGSGAIKGLGVKLAGSIVKKFKKDTFRIIEEEPERLAELKGISERKAMEIAEQVAEKKDMRKAMIYLQKYGITLGLAVKIYERYGHDVYRALEQNPYQLADQIDGVGFKTADEIAMKMGFYTDSDFRIRSGIFYALQQSVNEGHVYLPKEELLTRASSLLEVEIQDVESYLMDLSMDKKVVLKQQDEQVLVYPAHYYYMELNTAKMLHDLNIKRQVDQVQLAHRLDKIEDENGLVLDDMQRRAVIEAAENGILLLTGGPGTGKTTTINTMIHLFESEKMSFCLAAPTGRAAKRMTEATGYEAKTLHRLLEVSGNPEEEGNKGGFLRNEENPIEADVIIVDEMSMVDLTLMHALLRAVTVGTTLILVGDENQLPSVGCGSVLKDMIRSHCFQMIMLTRIFRQAGESDIVVNAHKINHGEPVILDNKSRDFFFLKRQDANLIIRVIIALLQEKLPAYVAAGTLDIQVLTPMRKGLLGVENLNRVLQRYLNPEASDKPEKEFADKRFRLGDKVMQIRNNYQLEWNVRTRYGMSVDKGLGIFNGDMGIITEINSYEETMEVTYDEERVVKYEFSQLEELELAYAITIHKSQGSEYPAVVIPLLSGPRQLMNRNLLYTAITRARKCVAVVGSDRTFEQMIQNVSEQKRYTGLTERIQEFG